MANPVQSSAESKKEQPKRAFQVNIQPVEQLPIPLQWADVPVEFENAAYAQQPLPDHKKVISQK